MNAFSKLIPGLALLTAIAAACDDDTASSDSAPAAAADAGGARPRPAPPTDSGATEDACHDLELGDAPIVQPVAAEAPDGGSDGGDAGADPYPPLTGGTIADGKYVLDSVVAIKVSPTVVGANREVWRVSGNRLDMIVEMPQRTERVVLRVTAELKASGSSLTRPILCKSPPGVPGAPLPGDYEATPDGVTLDTAGLRVHYKKVN